MQTNFLTGFQATILKPTLTNGSIQLGGIRTFFALEYFWAWLSAHFGLKN